MSDTKAQHEEVQVFRPRRGPTVDWYEPPRLFPRYYQIGSDHKRWEYVRDELVRMANENSLYLTDVLCQPPRVADTAADVIFGRCIEDHGQKQREVPEDLLSYRVHLKSLNGEPIAWCQDMVRGEPISKAGRAAGINGEDAPQLAYRVEEEWGRINSTEARLSLRRAVLCLRQGGKHVVKAKRSLLQDKFWKFEEIRPEGAPKAEEPPPTKVKRSFAEANTGG